MAMMMILDDGDNDDNIGRRQRCRYLMSKMFKINTKLINPQNTTKHDNLPTFYIRFSVYYYGVSVVLSAVHKQDRAATTFIRSMKLELAGVSQTVLCIVVHYLLKHGRDKIERMEIATAVKRLHSSSPQNSFRTTAFVVVAVVAKRASYDLSRVNVVTVMTNMTDAVGTGSRKVHGGNHSRARKSILKYYRLFGGKFLLHRLPLYLLPYSSITESQKALGAYLRGVAAEWKIWVFRNFCGTPSFGISPCVIQRVTKSSRICALERHGNLILMGVTVEFILLSIAVRAVPGGESTAISFIFRLNAAAPRANKLYVRLVRQRYPFNVDLIRILEEFLSSCNRKADEWGNQRLKILNAFSKSPFPKDILESRTFNVRSNRLANSHRRKRLRLWIIDVGVKNILRSTISVFENKEEILPRERDLYKTEDNRLGEYLSSKRQGLPSAMSEHRAKLCNPKTKLAREEYYSRKYA
ncbi:hypothetical protein G5I_05860 [Acromyrmex echinatior]|uniref:Uncharacterized protein n=1 Tax=Acromyrmex echinatior TaxID=103372 RepID=F4WJI1_ACREC|nr:hypothetical protein G5I_05860 [Acromyrmex echinatior]